jgi:hypothetical protein
MLLDYKLVLLPQVRESLHDHCGLEGEGYHLTIPNTGATSDSATLGNSSPFA